MSYTLTIKKTHELKTFLNNKKFKKEEINERVSTLRNKCWKDHKCDDFLNHSKNLLFSVGQPGAITHLIPRGVIPRPFYLIIFLAKGDKLCFLKSISFFKVTSYILPILFYKAVVVTVLISIFLRMKKKVWCRIAPGRPIFKIILSFL